MKERSLKKSILKNHAQFEDRIDHLIMFGLELIDDKLPEIKVASSKQEKSMLLESLLLRACALWESFVENELVLLTSLESTKLKKKMGLTQNSKLNTELIRALLYGGRYRNYNSIDQLKGSSKQLLSEEYNMFSKINRQQENKIDFSYKMRNYLSHYSRFSKKQLSLAYSLTFNRSKFQEPGYFLMNKRGKYFEKLIHNFKMTSIAMKQKLK